MTLRAAILQRAIPRGHTLRRVAQRQSGYRLTLRPPGGLLPFTLGARRRGAIPLVDLERAPELAGWLAGLGAEGRATASPL